MTRLLTRWRQLLVLTLLLLCSVGTLSARPLSERQARHLAEQFFLQSTRTTMSRPISQQGLQLVSAPIRQSVGVELRTLSGDKARYYYIYNRGSNAGFVIIAGDDELTPYIGYATTGRFIVEDMPEQLVAFLKACQERIDELVSSISYHQALQPTRPSASEPTQIAPLLGNIQWNQSAPWNNQTPVVDGEHTPVGCVATAYTQVMRYYQWPTQGEGTFSYTEKRSDRQHSVDYESTTYDWAHMPERYADPSQATEEETNALSTLAYHAGVAVEMMYAPRGSGASMPYVDRALREHFRYDKRVSFKNRVNYTQATWEQLLRNELIAARPIVYSGYGHGGHAFVCDGYDANGLFHINWGWGGMSDGYFNLNYLVPSDLGIGGGAGGGYSLGQGAVVGIMPDRQGTSQRPESSVVTTWRFSMLFDKGTLDATADYIVALVDDATPYDDLITYGVTRLGSTDTTYLDQYARNAHIESLYQSDTITSQKLQLSGYINEGTWDFFLAYRAKDVAGTASWRPCGQHERAKDQYRRTFTISREGDGSYTATEDASANQPKLELVAGSAQSKIAGYEKSQVSLQLRNTGRVEYFEQLYLFARKSGEKMFQPLLNLLPAIEAGGQERVTFDIERFPYGSGYVELLVGYFVKNDFTPLWSNTVSIQPATNVRTAYVLSSDQPVTANLSTGAISQMRIRNVGTTTAPLQGDLYYRWELSKGDNKASSEWTTITPISAGGEATFTPNLERELQKVNAQEGDEITLTATFVVLYNEGKSYSYIPLLEQGSLAVTCTKGHIIGDGIITMTTTKLVGETIQLGYEADKDVSVEGAELIDDSERFMRRYRVTNQQITLRGNITALFCFTQGLTDIDVSQCSSLSELYCFANEIKGKSMLQLVNSLPDRTGLKNGTLVVYSDGSLGAEGNVCLKSDVAIARAKNWDVKQLVMEYDDKLQLPPYDGEGPTKTFAVTLNQGDNGSISATGADDLNAVLEGTELTITDHPDEDYLLVALTANGEDILSTKKLNVREDTEIKATFAKKSYTVTFSTEGEGENKLTATRNGEPFTSGSPAHEGDKIVITAQPAEGYQIDKWLVGKEEIEFTPYTGQTTFECTVGTADVLIKATFAKKSYTVTFSTEGEGENKLTATRNGEPFTSGSPAHEGDKIVITAQPAEGYQIDKWLVGKEEIEFTPYTGQTTFECTVGTADVLIKATFAKKTYAVTLTYNEHGTISIVEPVDLETVPYGTTLTVQATGKNAQCELTALTANGEDILSSKKFTVKGATEVQATFVDHTSVETIAGHAVRIYPNPAQTFVLIEGLQPASQVSLYSMNGKQLYTGQTDLQGTLRIDLTALSDGVYLLVGEGWQKRLVVKQ
ncbi:C10 family peptidase [uncultured Porphyromonas sp.]|uniref:C10 family peptidase n=1 Tax=uncultured Porphyromonas sp. TaxID=159274 RepID=UPI00262B07A6|nr:C10 family peptidase [uncultured Porphyromonas sp.]